MSTLHFLDAWKTAPIDEATGRAKADFKEPPLWFFPVASHLNNDGGTQDPSTTYPKRFTIKVLDPYELTEFDAPAFLFLTGNMRVTIPHLRFRVHSVTWPRIKGLTNTLPLAQDQGISELFSDVEIDMASAPGKEPATATPSHSAKGEKDTPVPPRKPTAHTQAKRAKVSEK